MYHLQIKSILLLLHVSLQYSTFTYYFLILLIHFLATRAVHAFDLSHQALIEILPNMIHQVCEWMILMRTNMQLLDFVILLYLQLKYHSFKFKVKLFFVLFTKQLC